MKKEIFKRLTDLGLPVFPVIDDAKLPAVKDFQGKAAPDLDAWNVDWESYNIGISTQNLIAVDVDCGPGKVGADSLLALELEGKDLPETFTQETPNGGRHFIYRAPFPVKQGTSVLGKHIDIRAHGGYVVGAGSTIDGKNYTANWAPVAEAPQWLVDACGPFVAKEKRGPKVNEDRASARAIELLKSMSPAEPGDRNRKAYIAANLVKDEGVSQTLCLYLMTEYFNCEPPLEQDELQAVIFSAYKYGEKELGSNAPETVFSDPVVSAPTTTPHPFDELNKEFAFVVAGGGSHILWETTDANGGFDLQHVDFNTFHQMNASRSIDMGGKPVSLTKAWMTSPKRRSFNGICFRPGIETPERFYNLWRGFTVEPLPVGEAPEDNAKKSVDMFLEHAFENVCNKDETLFKWLIGYFAHLMQRPYEKPLTALVFVGDKGVGKSSLVERVGHLLGRHFLSTAKKRYLLGNFNSHLENNLMLVLEEAFWSGDKEAEGTLKDIITSRHHVIERKGREPYTVENCSRVVIIGNEDWVVPASGEERRFAVFNVTDGRKQDREFFKTIRVLMEQGGYSYLLRYLLDFDLSSVDANDAPNTQGLLKQKLESLAPFQAWLLECLREERIVGGDFGQGWPEYVEKDAFRNAYKRYSQDRNVRSWVPTDQKVGLMLRRIIPDVQNQRISVEGSARAWAYKLPNLEISRKHWEKFIGSPMNW